MSTEPTSTATPKKSSAKRLFLIAGILVLACGTAGAAWLYMQQSTAKDSVSDGMPKRKAQNKSIFIPLESFTVNLQDDGGEHYAQIGVTLEIEDAAIEADLKMRLPALRNNILLLIASKRTENLLSLEGKQLLSHQIGIRAAQAIGVSITDADLQAAPQASASQPVKPKVTNPIKDVLFSQFLVQ